MADQAIQHDETEQDIVEEVQQYKAKVRRVGSFDKALSEFIKSVNNSQDYALTCAQMAIKHFEEHGDLGYCQRFFDAMPNNYVRKAAFVKWLDAHSPILFSKGRFSKDKSENATAFDVDKALKVPFWEFAPDPEMIDYSSSDIIADLKRALKKRHGERQHPLNDEAKKVLHLAEVMVEELDSKRSNLAA